MMSMVSQLHSCLRDQLQLVLREQADTYNGAIYSQQGDNTRGYLRKQAKDLHVGRPYSGHR